MTIHAELVIDARADLGEAPIWDADAGLLVWVDITAGLVHRTDPATGRDDTIDVGRSVGAAVPTVHGQIAAATDDGFWRIDPATGEQERIAAIAGAPETIMNDGKTDPSGRFWAGTRDVEGTRPIAALYRLDADGTATEMVHDVTLSNGLGWSPDGRTMYYIDSTTYGIDAFDADQPTGALSERRRLVDLPRDWGLPDGMTVDEEGFLWVAFWKGSAIRRLDPAGRLTSVVDLPVSQVTSCAFGGPDLGDLFVTSARIGLSEEALGAEPHAGGLFRCRPGVRGRRSRPFG